MELDQLIADTGYGMNHRNRLFRRLNEFYPGFVESSLCHRKGVKHEMTLRKKSYSRLVDIVNGIQQNRKCETDGYLYCFFACESFRSVFMKIGRTHSVQERFQNYVGPMEPTEIVGSLYVVNQKAAEALLIREFSKRFKPVTREWFLIDDKTRHDVRSAWVHCCALIVKEEETPDVKKEDDVTSDPEPLRWVENTM
jgi:hypothetical protein